MKRRFKLCAAALAFAAFSRGAALAAVTKIESADNRVTVEGSAPARALVSIFLLFPGKTAADLKESAAIAHAAVVEADALGAYTYSFKYRGFSGS
jgi:hypothetical protein